MAKLHPPPISTIPRTSHILSSPINHNHSYCRFLYREHQYCPGPFSRGIHRKTSCFQNGTAQQEVGFAEADCLTMVHNPEDEAELNSSAMAIAMAIRRASASPVEFIQRVDKVNRGLFSCPSPDFRTLCNEQLALCANIVGDDTLLSVYIRPAGSYVTDQLELRRAVLYPGQELAEQDDMLVLIGTFGTQTGLHSAEAAFVERQVEELPEHNVLVLPMVKDLFLVGLLVAERIMTNSKMVRSPGKEVEQSCLASGMERGLREPSQHDGQNTLSPSFTIDQKAEAVKIARSLALAYVMDQRALLLQQTSWQKSVRMSNLMEQIRGPLSNIRTLSKMLLPHLQRSEIPSDILEDILVQGEHMNCILQELQDAFYYTKANLMHYREEDLNRVKSVRPNFGQTELASVEELNLSKQGHPFSGYNDNGKVNTIVSAGSKAEADLQLPMPPLALAALQQPNIRPCNVYKILSELVSAGNGLAHRQQQTLQLRESTHILQAAIEESALRQALSNLLDSALLRIPAGGWVKVEAMEAPGGGVLVVIDDNGPDMSLMTQTRSLAPFGSELSSKGRTQDNITWNFVAGISIAREILEHYGSVLRMLSPFLPNALIGAGGTHIEIWLPAALVDGSK